MTKIFLDTEFTHLGQDADLISIGLVSECGNTFYAEVKEVNKVKCSQFVLDNVLPNLRLEHESANKGK